MNNNVLALTGAEALFFLAGAMAFAAGLAVAAGGPGSRGRSAVCAAHSALPPR